MKTLSNCMDALFNQYTSSNPELKVVQRKIQVEQLWKDIVKKYFSKQQVFLLAHTNAVYLLTENNEKKFIVYMDDSQAISSINCNQGLVKIYCSQQGIEFDSFKIFHSTRGMKNRHPYLVQKTEDELKQTVIARDLTQEEKVLIAQNAVGIENSQVRKAYVEAFVATLKYDS